MNLIGKVLGNRYDIIEEIGIGGMATVYRAKCQLLNRQVAIKVLKKEFSQDAAFVKRFRAEAQSAASLTHPNIVSVYDVGEEDDINYIVMELLEGKTLKEYILKNGKMDSINVLKFSSQIASALEVAHKANIIHRDIKAQNIVFSNNDKIVKVTDFGIAKMTNGNTITSTTTTMGSVHYFSPEHAKGSYIDERSDIYSLGIVMYEMATGKLPFDSDTPVAVALKQIQEEPVPPIEINSEISEDLNNIILKAMQKNKANRYQTATAMLDELFAAINSPGTIFRNDPKHVSGLTQIIPIIGLKDENTSLETTNKENSEPNRREMIKKIDQRKEVIEELKNKKQELKEDKDKKPNVRRKKKKMIIVIILISLISITILGLTTKLIYNFVRDTKKTEISIEIVPSLIGKNYEEVKAEYAPLGLEISIIRYEYNADYEDGIVISQSQDAENKLLSNEIGVVVSKGQKMVNMIDVVGKDYTVAKYELEAIEIIPEFEFVIDDDVKTNIILSQETVAGEKIAAGQTVKIQVSQGNGKEIIVIPNLIGLTKAEASALISKLEIKVNYSQDTSKKDGVVIAQSIAQNKEVEEGTTITLTLNRLEKSKTVTITLQQLTEGMTEEEITVKVTAKVEGVTNTIFNQTKTAPYSNFTVNVNGFTNAVVYTYIDGDLAKEQTVTF